jgi:hypothetical protein
VEGDFEFMSELEEQIQNRREKRQRLTEVGIAPLSAPLRVGLGAVRGLHRFDPERKIDLEVALSLYQPSEEKHMKERLDAYLKEYDMLVAETRLWLAASDPKLTIAFATCAALAGAGAWNNKYPLILLIPLVVIFLVLILVYQLDNIIRLAAQLAVLEESVNIMLGGQPTLTYHSRTVVTFFDQRSYCDPITGKKRWSLNAIYTVLAMVILFFGACLAGAYGYPKLEKDHPRLAAAYAVLVLGGTAICLWLLARATAAKRWYLNIIRANLTSDPGGPLGGQAQGPSNANAEQTPAASTPTSA